VALPETAVFDKHLTIINPSHLPAAFRTQICGSCHSRGKSKKMEDVEWPVGYRPGRALQIYYESTSYAAGSNTWTGSSPGMPGKVSPAPPATTSISWACRRRNSRPRGPGLSSVSCATR
jgi:hypothetical protein